MKSFRRWLSYTWMLLTFWPTRVSWAWSTWAKSAWVWLKTRFVKATPGEEALLVLGRLDGFRPRPLHALFWLFLVPYRAWVLVRTLNRYETDPQFKEQLDKGLVDCEGRPIPQSAAKE